MDKSADNNDDGQETPLDLDALKAGDEDAWEAAFRYFNPKLSFLTENLWGLNAADSEDIIIAAFAALAKSIMTIADLSHFQAFLFRVARCRAIDILRDRIRRPTVSRDQQIDEKGAESEPIALKGGITETEFSDLVCSLAGDDCLTPDEVELLTAHFVEGLTQIQLSKRFKRPPGTIANQIAFILRKIRRNRKK